MDLLIRLPHPRRIRLDLRLTGLIVLVERLFELLVGFLVVWENRGLRVKFQNYLEEPLRANNLRDLLVRLREDILHEAILIRVILVENMVDAAFGLDRVGLEVFFFFLILQLNRKHVFQLPLRRFALAVAFIPGFGACGLGLLVLHNDGLIQVVEGDVLFAHVFLGVFLFGDGVVLL